MKDAWDGVGLDGVVSHLGPPLRSGCLHGHRAERVVLGNAHLAERGGIREGAPRVAWWYPEAVLGDFESGFEDFVGVDGDNAVSAAAFGGVEGFVCHLDEVFCGTGKDGI